MKKGLLNLILLVLVITNVALTAVLVFAIVPAMNATTELVGKVAKAIDLEKELKDQQSDILSIDETKQYTFSDKMTISLKPSGDGVQHYASFKLTLVLDKTDPDYSKYEPKLIEFESIMMGTVNSVLDDYTAEQLSDSTIRDTAAIAVRDALRKQFNETEFIYNITFSGFVIQ